jgi:hypothetical protein
MIGVGCGSPRGGGSGGGGGTLTIGVFSDAGHTTPIITEDIGATIYILATPTGATPTNYVFWAYNPTTEESVVIDDEATGSVSWLIPSVTVGDWEIRCDAKDGTSDLIWGFADLEITLQFLAETTAYMTALGIAADSTVYYPSTSYERTGVQLWGYVNNWFNTYISEGILSKYYFKYLYIGGTAFRHSINAIDPRDLDAAFRITWYGGITHGATGVQGNAVNGYGDTHFVDSSVGIDRENIAMSLYSRTHSTTGYDMGVFATGTYTFMESFASYTMYSTTLISTGIINTLGRISTGKIGTTVNSSQYGIEIRSDTLATQAYNNSSMLVVARKSAAGPAGFSGREYCVHEMSEYLTPAEELIAYNADQALQTALGRQV